MSQTPGNQSLPKTLKVGNIYFSIDFFNGDVENVAQKHETVDDTFAHLL